jgi:hypothetical protein
MNCAERLHCIIFLQNPNVPKPVQDRPYMRYRILVSLLFLVPAGFYTKFYHGPAARWVSDSFGGVLYEIFWCLAAAFAWPKVSPRRIAVIVFMVTAFLEFTQLWHPAFLIPVRENFLGCTLIGNSFTWSDFPYYAVGSFLGALWILGLRRLSRWNENHPS